MVRPKIQSQRFDVFRTPKPPTRAAVIDTMPDGTFNNAEIRGVYPAFFKRVLEY